MAYVSLHNHSTFSILDAVPYPADLVDKATEIDSPAVALTDHGNTSGWVKLEQATKEGDIKPIYGCELYMVEDVGDNKQRKNHITLLAKNEEGMQNILELSSLAHKEGYFYYRPTVGIDELIKYRKGVVLLSGCLSGLIPQKILDDDLVGAKKIANKLKSWFGDDFYLEVQPFDLEDSVKINKGLIVISETEKIPLVATNDVHFIEPEDRNIQNFLYMIRTKSNIRETENLMSPIASMADEEQMLEWFEEHHPYHDFSDAVQRTEDIAEDIRWLKLPQADPVQYIDGDKETRDEILMDWLREGWIRRGLNDLDEEETQEYLDRMFHELDLIKSKDYVDYFLVTADMVRWSKEQNILVGPARGSAAGSLVSYLLEITEVDPIEYNLMFERFLDPGRPDPPDIDLDFQDDRRDEVKDYLREKYGYDRVTNIAGYSQLKPKSLLDDIGRCYNISRKKISELKDELKEEGGTKTVKEILEDEYPELIELHRAKGCLRGLTVHAAGVIVASDSIDKFTTIGRDGIMLDYRDAEYLNLLKIDALSLKNLTVISKILEEIGMTPEELYDLPFNDKKTLDAFNGDYFKGIFQFEGRTTMGICQQVFDTVDWDDVDYDDLFKLVIDANALSRPGALNTGATDAYIANNEECDQPLIAKHTADTRSQVLFQEQIMYILKEASTLTWGEVNKVRKAIQGKLPNSEEILERIKTKFREECPDGVKVADEIWSSTAESASYSFNLSHSVSYAMLTYYTMYLKVYYPLEFYWANMYVRPGKESVLREYIRRGGKVYRAIYPKAEASWKLEEDGIRAGYMTIHGIGPKTSEKLVDPDWELKGRAKSILEEKGLVDCADEPVDYLGIEELREQVNQIDGRVKIINLEPGRVLTIAGRIKKQQVKNLREVIESQGKVYEDEVSSPEHDTYINMVLMDDTGECYMTVNRFKCADPIVFETVTEYDDDDIFKVVGEYNEEYNKVYVTRIQNYTQKEDEIPEWMK
jgi:DNA polymerase-3 subunit alpha